METIVRGTAYHVTKAHDVWCRFSHNIGGNGNIGRGDSVFNNSPHILVVIPSLLAVFPVDVQLAGAGRISACLLDHFKINNGTVCVGAGRCVAAGGLD